MKVVICICVIMCMMALDGVKAAKVKLPKPVKQLNTLCRAWDVDLVNIREPIYDVVFEELGDFCPDLLVALNGTGKTPTSPVDGINLLGKVCKWYGKGYKPNRVSVDLTELNATCILNDAAKVAAKNDKPARKAMKKLTSLCAASAAGNVDVNNASYADVMADMDEFCVDFNSPTETNTGKARRQDGVKALGEICVWYTDKYEVVPAPGTMGDLEPICEDYIDVRDGNDDDDDDDIEFLKDEKEFWMLVQLCKADAMGAFEEIDEDYEDLFEDLGDFCDDFLEAVNDTFMGDKKMRPKADPVDMLEDVCDWYEDLMEEGESIDMLDGLDSVCEDLEEIEDGREFNITEEKEFWALVRLCMAEEQGAFDKADDDYEDLFESLGEFCEDFLEAVNDTYMGDKKMRPKMNPLDVLDDVCDWYEDVMEEEEGIDILDGLDTVCEEFEEIEDDDDDEFDLKEEKEFWALVRLCKADENGTFDEVDEDYEDLFDSLGEFCDDFLEALNDTYMGKKKMEPKMDPLDMLDDVCEWYEDVMEEEEDIDMLDGLDSVCEELEEIEDDEDEDGEEPPKEFNSLVKLCYADQKMVLNVTDSRYDDVFDDFSDFCEDFLEELKPEEKMKPRFVDGIVQLRKICTWYEDELDEEKLEDVLEDLEPVCSDFFDIDDAMSY